MSYTSREDGQKISTRQVKNKVSKLSRDSYQFLVLNSPKYPQNSFEVTIFLLTFWLFINLKASFYVQLYVKLKLDLLLTLTFSSMRLWFLEMEAVSRFRKKVEKEESYAKTIATLGERVEQIIRQNNAIDIYEEYFTENLTSQMQQDVPR